jgi:hypothetical protein
MAARRSLAFGLHGRLFGYTGSIVDWMDFETGGASKSHASQEAACKKLAFFSDCDHADHILNDLPW